MKFRIQNKCKNIQGNATAYLFRLLNPLISRHYQGLVSEGDLVFDVGANVGELTQVFSDLGAQVIAIEPQSNCAEILKKRFAAKQNVKIVEKGLSDSTGSLKFYLCKNGPATSTFSENWVSESRYSSRDWHDAIMVPTVTLDRMIALFGRPQFCKIDVEGYELQVLRGLSTRIPYISFEFVSEFLDLAKMCMDYLASLGKVRFNASLFCSYTFCFRTWLSSEKLMERISRISPLYLSGDIYARFE